MANFYTNVQNYGSKILYRGVENGRRVMRRVDYHPSLFVPSSTPTKYTTIHGEYLGKIQPGDLRETKDFIKQYDQVQNFKIYGNQKFEYTFISDQHPESVDWDKQHIRICNIDIEVGSENGFPEPETASEPVVSITHKIGKKVTVFGLKPYQNSRTDVEYILCNDEVDLLKRFIVCWCEDYPDIITGWFIKSFDIPYLINRIKKILGDSFAKMLSPWKIITERFVDLGPGRRFTAYTLQGISTLDYVDLYQRYAPEGKSQESYKLDNIAHVELKERKLSYEEYGNLHTLYKVNHQLFIDYNIRDVELIERLDDKLKLIDLALTLSYDSKTNYDDVFAQVRMWDALIYNKLRENNQVVPPIERHSKDEAYIGAYVKDPILGMHKWIASFDLNSLYPHLIIQYNISPEMFIEPENYTDEQRKVLAQNISIESLLNRENDLSSLKTCTVTPNQQFFRTDKTGFLAQMMSDMYNDRTLYKKKSIEAKKELEKVKTEINRRKKIKQTI